jgi:hypothetical protein
MGLPAFFGPVSLGAWVALTGWFVIRGRRYARGIWSPFLFVGWAVLLGLASGFVGAFAGWEMYQLGWGAPARSGGFPGIPLPAYWYGDREGLIRWPIVGAVTCGFVAVVTSAADLMRGPQEPRQ